MAVKYSLYLLREMRQKSLNTLLEIEENKYKSFYGEDNVKKLRTKLIHDIGDLEFAIEVLETYED
jgi:hypothetical protein